MRLPVEQRDEIEHINAIAIRCSRTANRKNGPPAPGLNAKAGRLHQDKPEGFLIGQKMEILNRYTNGCIWIGDAETMREAVEKAVNEGAHLEVAHLGGADLRRANLRGADLRGANLRGAHLGGAHLEDANLGGADLGGADLRRANLGGAHLGGANLEGAHLEDANLGGANLEDAKISRVLQIGPIGSRNACLLVWCMADGSRRYSTGCQVQISEEAFLARVSEAHGDNEHARSYRAAVEFAHAIHAIILPEAAK